MIAKSFVAPIDRIKILYQVTSAQFRLRDVPKVAYSIIETEGTAALWKGNTATMIRVFPYSGIQFMMFDYCKVYFLSSSSNPSFKSPGGDYLEFALVLKYVSRPSPPGGAWSVLTLWGEFVAIAVCVVDFLLGNPQVAFSFVAVSEEAAAAFVLDKGLYVGTNLPSL